MGGAAEFSERGAERHQAQLCCCSPIVVIAVTCQVCIL